jgi:hypothetical protein
VWIFNPHADDVYELAMVGACVVYLSLFWCFLLFKVHYGSMDRTFVNPLGSASAIYGILYFSVVIVSLLFVQLDFNALIAFVPLMILAIIYYYRVVESRQFFSKEEQQKFMKAYILNANRKKKKGLSPFMKGLRDMYIGCGLEPIGGEWTLGASVRDNASIVSGGSNRSNRSRSMSRKSGKSLQRQSSNSVSMSEHHADSFVGKASDELPVGLSADVDNKEPSIVDETPTACLEEGCSVIGCW